MIGGIVNGSVKPSSIVSVEHDFFISAYAALPNIVMFMFPVASSISAVNLYVKL